MARKKSYYPLKEVHGLSVSKSLNLKIFRSLNNKKIAITVTLLSLLFVLIAAVVIGLVIKTSNQNKITVIRKNTSLSFSNYQDHYANPPGMIPLEIIGTSEKGLFLSNYYIDTIDPTHQKTANSFHFYSLGKIYNSKAELTPADKRQSHTNLSILNTAHITTISDYIVHGPWKNLSQTELIFVGTLRNGLFQLTLTTTVPEVYASTGRKMTLTNIKRIFTTNSQKNVRLAKWISIISLNILRKDLFSWSGQQLGVDTSTRGNNLLIQTGSGELIKYSFQNFPKNDEFIDYDYFNYVKQRLPNDHKIKLNSTPIKIRYKNLFTATDEQSVRDYNDIVLNTSDSNNTNELINFENQNINDKNKLSGEKYSFNYFNNSKSFIGESLKNNDKSIVKISYISPVDLYRKPFALPNKKTPFSDVPIGVGQGDKMYGSFPLNNDIKTQTSLELQRTKTIFGNDKKYSFKNQKINSVESEYSNFMTSRGTYFSLMICSNKVFAYLYLYYAQEKKDGPLTKTVSEQTINVATTAFDFFTNRGNFGQNGDRLGIIGTANGELKLVINHFQNRKNSMSISVISKISLLPITKF